MVEWWCKEAEKKYFICLAHHKREAVGDGI